MESQSEVLSFRFNPVNPGFIAGGCLSGQVVLWDISDHLELRRRGSTRKAALNKEGTASGFDDTDDHGIRHPIFVSNVDHSHNKAVADLFWLPASTQINYRSFSMIMLSFF